MNSLSTSTLNELLDRVSSGEAVPGGGAAAAVTGALGTALLLMVARLPRTRTGAADEAERLAAAAVTLTPLRDRLVALADQDAEAYFAVMSAYRLPKATDSERSARRAGIDAAMERATDVPLDIMRLCHQALRDGLAVATCGAGSAAGEVVVAVELLTAALRGAAGCVDANLTTMKESGYIGRVAPERLALEAGAREHGVRMRAALKG